MLEGLDAIDWANLTHAYGSAGDVPDQLRALAFGDAEERESALWALYGNIYHQGTVYKATAYVVPFLVEMVANPSFPNKEEVLLLLAHLATGHSYLDAHKEFTWEQERAAKDPEGFQAQLQEELGWVKAARQAVYQSHHTYIALLETGETKTRATAAYLLSCFGDHYGTLLPVLSKRLGDESNTAVESALILAVGYLAPYGHTDTVAGIEPYLAPDYPLLTRWAAAMTLARLLTSTAPNEALNLLVKILQSSGDIETLNLDLSEIPWWEGGVPGPTCSALSYMGKERVSPYIPQLLDTLPEISPFLLESVVYALLFLAFEGQALQPTFHARDLDTVQRRTLQAIADHAIEFRFDDGRVSRSANVAYVLRSFKLPDSKEKLLDFLQGHQS